MKASVFLFLTCTTVFAESGYDAWLRYAPVPGLALPQTAVVVQGQSDLLESAQREAIRAIKSITGRTLRARREAVDEDSIVISVSNSLPADAFTLRTVRNGTHRNIAISGGNDRGALYGTFALLRKLAGGEPIATLDERQLPAAPIRWLNHWDNLDGTIERGYGGRSIFWDANVARADMQRVSDYGRLLASLGINGTSINNVNANPRILAPEFLPEIAKVAAALRPWGVQTIISVDFGSPQKIGGLDTFDPLDPKVIAWWKTTIDHIYTGVPDLAGIIIKADSEGRVGPSAYGRTHADAANVVARALKPHGGRIFYRGFVYNNKMDWNDPKNDRGRAAYDNFKDLDGKFDDNVVIQIKNGPIDFQVREPASPLFAALDKTNQVIELQVTQEYMGQAHHTVFLVPMWKDVLDFDMRKNGTSSPVKKLVAKTGFVAVTNVGLDDNWFANHMSQANLYGFGRLAWNPDLTSRQIADEWTKLTFGLDPTVVRTISNLQVSSMRTYENYTGPLGLQTLTDIVGNHYGVAVEASERNGWGQWHKADAKGVGMDRTVASGTGYIGQYPPEVAAMYEKLATCPDDLLLFLHHVPYTYRLHSGKTAIQSLYDSHYTGAAAVEQYVTDWKSLAGKIDERRYHEVLAQLEYQAGQAQVWRDAVNQWFFKESAIADEQGRVGHYPGRIEAEAMTLSGYAPVDVKPWETASGQAVACLTTSCSASFTFAGTSGWHSIKVRYFDANNGESRFVVRVGDQVIDEWRAALRLPSAKLDGTTSTRRTIPNVALRPGDRITIEGYPQGQEQAALDYVEID